MKEIAYYKTNPVKYPARPVKPELDRPTHEFVELLDKYDREMLEYESAKREWHKNNNMRHEEFKHDILEDCGILNHPKSDILYRIAWDYGHSAGYGEVANYVRELSELLT
jgi:hypothetical protein